MSYKNWRNQEVNDRLMESWGFKVPKAEVLTEGNKPEPVELPAKSIQEQEVEESEEVVEGAMPMKTDTKDLDDDGKTDDEVPAFLKEKAEELEEISIPGSAASKMDAVLAQFEKEDVEAWLRAQPPAQGTATKTSAPPTRRLEPARNPYSVRFEEEKVRGAVREAISKALKKRSNKEV